MEEVEVPPYFLCPISLQIMRDPVTLLSGITYDRESIEQWIYSDKHNTCPATNQQMENFDLTPNHTLRRLIQAWCTVNASNGIERYPTPRHPVDKAQISELLNELNARQTQLLSLRKLKVLVSENDRNKRYIEASGAADVLVSIVEKSSMSNNQDVESSFACHEALSILCSLRLSEQILLHLMESSNNLLDTLTKIMSYGSHQSKAYVVLLLRDLMQVIPPSKLYVLSKEFFDEIVILLRDRISNAATKAAIQILIIIGLSGKNRIKAVKAGAVPALVELLFNEHEKRETEMILIALGKMCGCAEGRADLVSHAAGIAVVSKKIMRVSALANYVAVKILCSIAKLSPSTAVLQEMLQVGMVSKLCLLLQTECGVKTNKKINEILKLHSKAWRNSSCLSFELKASYPLA